jgi:hypothetical protein
MSLTLREDHTLKAFQNTTLAHLSHLKTSGIHLFVHKWDAGLNVHGINLESPCSLLHNSHPTLEQILYSITEASLLYPKV